MRSLIILAAFAALAACSQETTTAPSDSAEPAAAAPAASSMSEADAQARAEAAGYTAVTDLAPNPDGSWSAMGTKDGAAIQLTITESGAAPTLPPTP